MSQQRISVWIRQVFCGALLVGSAACADGAGPSKGAFFTAVSAGGTHTCAIAEDGAAYCWGRGENGELGDGEVQDQWLPSPVKGDHRWSMLSAGENHTCGVTTDGAALCWGWNFFGQLGTGSTVGYGGPSPVSKNLPFDSVSAGAFHTCAVTTDGVAYCWGDNSYGQVGDGSTEDKRTDPTAVAGGLRFRQVDAGRGHSCGVTVDGRAYCWGLNHRGQLGDSTTTDHLEPVAVFGDLRFESVSAGAEHSCGVATDGSVYCWGSNRYGELGNARMSRPRVPGSIVPVRVHGSGRYRAVDAGEHYTCGIKAGNKAVCWGRGFYGQLGNGFQSNVATPRTVAPRPREGYMEFASVSTGGNHTCGTTPERAVWCWGTGELGQLGNPSTTFSALPVRVPGVRDK